MSHTYPVMVNQPRIKLKAIRRRVGGLDQSEIRVRPSVILRESGTKSRSPKIQIHELVGEAYTVLSLAGIIGVLIYHIAG